MSNYYFSKLLVYLLAAFVLSITLGCEKVPEFFRFGRPKEEEYEAKPTKVIKGEVLAKVNDRIITLEEFNEKRDFLSGEVKELYSGANGAKMFLDILINREVLICEALDRRLNRDETVIKTIEAFKEQVLIEKIQAMEMEKVSVDSREIEDYYNSYREVFKEPETRRVRAIVLSSESDAKSALIELLKGVDFATMAKERSIAPSAKDGGDLGFIARKTAFTPADKKTTFPKLENSAFSLNVGSVSSIFKGPDGYYIIKIEEIKQGEERGLHQVYDEIEQAILVRRRQQALEEMLSRLRKEAKIEINDWLLR